MLTSYQFSSNTPIWATDLDGREARIYTDNSIPIGHTFISIIDDNNVINVYTYGQYGEGNNSEIAPIGTGVLIHFKGVAANTYINEEFKKYGKKMSVFELSDKVIDKHKVQQYYQEDTQDDKPATSTYETIGIVTANPQTGSTAVAHGRYEGIPGILDMYSSNCTQEVLSAYAFSTRSYASWLRAFSSPIPQDLDNTLRIFSKISPDYINVTQDAKAKAANNSNSQ